MIQHIKCWLGFHYFTTHYNFKRRMAERECLHCGKQSFSYYKEVKK